MVETKINFDLENLENLFPATENKDIYNKFLRRSIRLLRSKYESNDFSIQTKDFSGYIEDQYDTKIIKTITIKGVNTYFIDSENTINGACVHDSNSNYAIILNISTAINIEKVFLHEYMHIIDYITRKDRNYERNSIISETEKIYVMYL